MTPMRCCSARRRADWGWRTWPGWPRRCASGPGAGLPDEDPGREFADRGVKLATTFGGAGVVHGDLTPECAAIVGKVLDALGAKAGKEDDRTKDQRYHDALAEAMRRLVAAGLLPER